MSTRKYWTRIIYAEAGISKYNTLGEVILIGDFNRTTCLLGYINWIDSKHLPITESYNKYNKDVSQPRDKCDNTINSLGKALTDLCTYT